ncbi:hypothetical protein IAG44_26925 [Streptomyces roseirectus]|uniref:Uncharacterized protein n=1 Tax=Streptomyces roseirectus TaxID=2768066 RepID=A0A7H0IIT5_9ACTN|nr:hypothetical protein [Streptomyces roseirectus]QNP72701.1 hypothetical protein IAG44_26925 [Streptomyces roseirectus]
MRRITGRAVRTALAALAVTATLALPLGLAGQHGASPAQDKRVVAADGLDDPVVTKPTKPSGDDTGSWVWDGWE